MNYETESLWNSILFIRNTVVIYYYIEYNYYNRIFNEIALLCNILVDFFSLNSFNKYYLFLMNTTSS